jgi:8-oxo-dGTP pyrophosphatase MutT (NUDIX family)
MPGGKIHSGEHIEEAVEREVLEECGIRTRFQRFCGVLSEKVENRDATVFAPKTGGVPVFHYIVLVSRLTALTSRITPSREGEVRWFPLANLRQLRKLMIPSDYLMLQRFVLRRSSRPYYRCTIGIGVHPRSSAVAGRYLVRRFY